MRKESKQVINWYKEMRLNIVWNVWLPMVITTVIFHFIAYQVVKGNVYLMNIAMLCVVASILLVLLKFKSWFYLQRFGISNLQAPENSVASELSEDELLELMKADDEIHEEVMANIHDAQDREDEMMRYEIVKREHFTVWCDKNTSKFEEMCRAYIDNNDIAIHDFMDFMPTLKNVLLEIFANDDYIIAAIEFWEQAYKEDYERVLKDKTSAVVES